jgi:hypothetical protein
MAAPIALAAVRARIGLIMIDILRVVVGSIFWKRYKQNLLEIRSVIQWRSYPQNASETKTHDKIYVWDLAFTPETP